MKQKKSYKRFIIPIAIILIIAFLTFAFYAIGKFLDLQKEVKYTQFSEDLQSDIDTLWQGSGKKQVDYFLPSEAIGICFQEDDFEDLVFSLKKDFRGGIKIDHLKLEKKVCIESVDNHVKFILSKDYGESLVSILQNE